MVKIGIIGGSGLDDPKILENYSEREINTKYGNPSSKITQGMLLGAEVYIIARHGKKHDIPPSLVNYRANIAAMKILGCDYILATTAVGSLREEIKPLDIIFPGQFIDFTKQRKSTFYDQIGEVKHTPMSEPFNKKLRDILCNVCEELGINYHRDKTVITIEGPRFSTKAESYMFQQFGNIINMSACPEVILANEAEIPYQLIAMSTDYDCWKEGEEPVTWKIIEERMHSNADKVKRILVKGIEKIVNSDEEFIKSRIRAIPNFPKPGIIFRDITTLIKDPKGFQKTMDIFESRYKNREIDVVAGIESRGLIFGSVLADRLRKGFVPIRKPGKLPCKTLVQEYDTEYSKDRMEVHEDAIKVKQKVLLIDDLLATGGTIGAAGNLIERLGGEVAECGVVVELPALKGREKLKKWKVFSIVNFEGD